MKKGTREWRAALAGLCAALLFTGCGKASDAAAAQNGYSVGLAPMADAIAETAAYDEKYGVEDQASFYEAGEGLDAGGMAEETYEPAQESAVKAAGQRKLIRTVNLEVETKEYDSFLDALEAEVQERDGYIERRDSYNGSPYSPYSQERYATLVLRIPQEKLDSFLERVSGIGNVTSRSDNVEDVTLRYVDMESRRDALRTEQERLLVLLEQAQSIEDIIAIEERLSEVRYQLESMESSLRAMENQVDYSTVYLNVGEVKELTPVAEQTVWERIRDGFAQSLQDIGQGAVDFAVWLTVHLPYLILWAAGIAVLAFVLLRLRKRRAARKREKTKEPSEKGAADDGKTNL